MSQDIWTPSKQYSAQNMGNGLRMLKPCETVSQGPTRTGLCFAEAALLVRRRVIPNVICALTGAEKVCYGPSPGPPQAPGYPSAHNGLVCGRQMDDGQGPSEQGRPTSTGRRTRAREEYPDQHDEHSWSPCYVRIRHPPTKSVQNGSIVHSRGPPAVSPK